MYHAIVRARIRSLFDSVNKGDAGPVLAGFATRFEHRFLGEGHALSGVRTSLSRTKEWYERLYRLLPDLHFDLDRIDVSGPPWNTLAIVTWRETNSGTDGVRTHNRGIHAVHLAWGKMTSLQICPDTAGLVTTLDRLAAAGNKDARAAPITD